MAAAFGVCACTLPAVALAALTPATQTPAQKEQTAQMLKCMAQLKKEAQDQQAAQQKTSTKTKTFTPQGGTLGTADKCTHEKVQMDKGKIVTIQLSRLPDSKKQCKANQCDNLCKKDAQGKWIGGTVTILPMVPGQPIITVSKCDPKYSALTSAFTAGQAALDSAGDALKQAAEAIGNGYEVPQEVKDRLAAAGFDYKQVEQVAAKINENPEKVDEMLQALASGDAEKAKAAAGALGLSEDQLSKFKDSMAQMTPEKIMEAMPPEMQNLAKQFGFGNTFGETQGSDSSTGAKLRGGPFAEMFAREAAKYPNLPPDVLPGTMAIEDPRGSNRCSHIGACGIFQYTPGTWNTWANNCVRDGMCDASVISQNMRYSPEAAASVTAYYMSKNMEKHGDLIERSGMNPATALYMIHNLGDSGGLRFIRAFAENPNASIWAGVTQKEAVNNPLLYRGMQTLADVEQNVTRLMAGDVTGFSGRYASVQTRMGSPFASLNPFNSSMYSNSGYAPYTYSAPTAYPTQQQVGYPASSVQPYQQPQQQYPAQQPTAVPPPPPVVAPAITPVATLIAPMRVSRGNTIVLSWSSIGMMRGIPCVLAETAPESVKLAEANGGEYRLKTATSSSAARYSFSLTCRAASDASTITRSASVVIE